MVKVPEPVDLWLEWDDPDELREGEPVVSLSYPAPTINSLLAQGQLFPFFEKAPIVLGSFRMRQ